MCLVLKQGSFSTFCLTERRIEANPDKCTTIITHEKLNQCERSAIADRAHVALSHFLSASGDNRYPYF